MGSHTNDLNTCLLKQLITSFPRSTNIANSTASVRNEVLLPSSANTEDVRRFCRFYYSGTKIPSDLLQVIVTSPSFDSLCKAVLNNDIFKKYPLRKSYRRSLLKEISTILGDETPDEVYDALSDCVIDTDECSYRFYMNDSGRLLCTLKEHNQQLCHGTTGLSLWQASCDLANLLSFCNLENKHILELGAGCGLAGIAAASYCSNCSVLLTDYDPKVLAQLNVNVDENFDEKDRVRVSFLDWSSFHISQIEIHPDIVVASDVVYDRALLPSLCTVIYSLLTAKVGSFALVASTLRDPDTLRAFRKELEAHDLSVCGEASYFRGVYEFTDKSRLKCETRFPFHSTLDTPTIVYYLCSK